MGLRDEHGAPRSVPAKAENPDLTDAAAFAKIFSAQDEAGMMLRKAYNVVQNAAHMADQDDSAEAIRELQAIGKRRWPGLTPHQQFARAMETNIDLANRAHKRRGPTMLFSEILIGLRGAFGLSAPQGNNGDVCVFAVAGSG